METIQPKDIYVFASTSPVCLECTNILKRMKPLINCSNIYFNEPLKEGADFSAVLVFVDGNNKEVFFQNYEAMGNAMNKSDIEVLLANFPIIHWIQVDDRPVERFFAWDEFHTNSEESIDVDYLVEKHINPRESNQISLDGGVVINVFQTQPNTINKTNEEIAENPSYVIFRPNNKRAYVCYVPFLMACVKLNEQNTTIGKLMKLITHIDLVKKR